MKPRVCLIVLNWNGKDVLQKCVESIFKNTEYSNYRVIVVDNNSTDDSLTRIKKYDADILALNDNYGFSKGMNSGAWLALKQKPKYIVFMNNDVTVHDKKWLSILIEDLEADKGAAAACPTALQPDGVLERGADFIPSWKGNIRNFVDAGEKRYVDFATGACIVIRVKALKKTGLYDERFSPFWYEDADLFLRLKKAGYTIIYNPAVTIRHSVSHSIKKANPPRKIEFRNFVRFAHKHFPYSVFLGALCNILLKGCFSFDFEEEKIRLTNEEAESRIKPGQRQPSSLPAF
jgi:GT2 family glycosyltransferase